VIPTILLAAGSAERFGAQKLLQELDGKPLIRWTAEALDAVVPDRMFVVVPPHAGKIRAALSGLRVTFVENRRAEEGIGTSIAAGAAVIDDDADGVLVTLADVPFGPSLILPAVVQRFRKEGADVVTPSYRGTPGHPVLFGRSILPELRALSGDRGARSIVEADPARVTTLELDIDPPRDVDTPADLARLRL
jgi:molybdenum cofactor cytidylyltransferase